MSAPAAKPRVKHMRLFGFHVEPETSTVRWLLSYIGHTAAVEFVDVNIASADGVGEPFWDRNPFRSVPFLEVILDGSQPCPPGTMRVEDLMQWKQDAPFTTHTAGGEQVAEPSDRVFPLTQTGAICTFLCEHFGVTGLWDPRSAFQRCRVQELAAHNELLARRVVSMVIVFIFTRTKGTPEEDIITAITAHERELLWSFRQIEDSLTANEATSAATAGLDYEALLAKGAEEVRAKEREADEAAEKAASSAKKMQRAETSARGFTSAALVALDSFMGGRALSCFDFTAGTYLKLLPYLQAWLPGSLRQRNFPAILRYLDRLRMARGYEEALKPRLGFLKKLRRCPELMSSSPLLDVYTARVQQAIAEGSYTPQAQADRTRADPRLLPQQHIRALSHLSDPTMPSSDACGSGAEGGVAKAHPATRGRPQDPLKQWSTRLSAAPMCYPHTLSAKDEEALRRSKRPKSRKFAWSADGRAHPCTALAVPFQPNGGAAQRLQERSRTAVATRAEVRPSVWRHDPYVALWRHDPYECRGNRVDGAYPPS